MTKKLILVVCRGNIGRSPFAEAIIAREITQRGLGGSLQVLSRGVQGTRVDPAPVAFPNITYYNELFADTKPVLEKFGVDLSQHVSKPITEDDVTQATVILAMDGKTRTALETLFPGEKHKVHLVTEMVGSDHDIVDPEGVSGAERQAKIFGEIEEVITTGFNRLEEMVK